MSDDRHERIVATQRALDEARFGREGTLNLRDWGPSPVEAERRADSWIRERQAAGIREVLIITGRGNQSWDGVSVVREAVEKLLAALRRRGIIVSLVEHTPGSFAMELAPFRALRDAPGRVREQQRTHPLHPAELRGLAAETRALLRELAARSVEELGVHEPERFLNDEMVRQFSYILSAVPEGSDREARLRAAMRRAIDGYDDA